MQRNTDRRRKLTGRKLYRLSVFKEHSKGFGSRTRDAVNETYPLLTVLVDGGWPKRGYGHSYDSNAGVGVIIGERTGKVLYMGSRIKTCRSKCKFICEFFMPLYCERISRDTNTNDIWSSMKARLVKFYVDDMAPEIIDPIFIRRQVAMDEAKNLKEQKKLKSSGACQQ